ncbi:hypothetical protein VPH35_032759 [Triticum aestivum]
MWRKASLPRRYASMNQASSTPKWRKWYAAVDLRASSHGDGGLAPSRAPPRSASSPHGVHQPSVSSVPCAGCRWLPLCSVHPPPAARDGPHCHVVLLQPDRHRCPRAPGRGSFLLVRVPPDGGALPTASPFFQRLRRSTPTSNLLIWQHREEAAKTRDE